MSFGRLSSSMRKRAANAAILKRLAEIEGASATRCRVAGIHQKLLPLLTPPSEPQRRQIGFSSAL
jgi:hypothetical protein